GIFSLLAISVVIILLSARRAQQLARKQMEFVAGVSHEFRTPLSVIHAISENLADGLITERQEVERCGMVIRDDVRRLAGMVERVLELAGVYRAKNLYQLQPINLTELIERVLAAYPAQERLEIEKQIDPDLPAVMADPAALSSAVRNILDNAAKYGGPAGWIAIKGPAPAGNPKGAVQGIVEDRGIGIPPADLPHVFEPFYRGRDVRAAQIHGNGLGLSLVKNIVDAHGGSIAVSSTQGQGTCFTLTLPAVSEDRPSSSVDPGKHDASTGNRG